MSCNLQRMRLWNHFLITLDIWRSVYDLDYGNEPSSENKESSTSSTVHAIKQAHTKRPMSRMEVPSHISSKDKHRDHEEENCDDLSSSSSTMISFELSNDRPCGPHVPATLDDDEYVEYQLEDLTGFPSSAEEEERIFMEAVMVSLKDLEITNPQVEPPVSSFSTVPVEPSDKDDSHASSHEIPKPMETESSLVKHSMHSTTNTISTASDDACGSLKAESNSISAIHSQNSASKPSQPPIVTLSSLDTSLGTEPGNSASASGLGDSSAGVQSLSDTDISHNTKATLTVVRNPTGHILNGLMRRWDFNNFFRK